MPLLVGPRLLLLGPNKPLIALVAAALHSNPATQSPIGDKPSGVQAGDVMIAAVGIPNTTSDVDVPPSGWALLDTTDGSTARRMKTYWKLAGGSEASTYTFHLTGATNTDIIISAYRNVDQTTPIQDHAAQSNASTTNCIAPSVTSAKTHSLLVCVFFDSANAVTVPASMTQRSQSSAFVKMALADEDVGSGATGTRTATLAGAQINVGQSIVVNRA